MCLRAAGEYAGVLLSSACSLKQCRDHPRGFTAKRMRLNVVVIGTVVDNNLLLYLLLPCTLTSKARKTRNPRGRRWTPHSPARGTQGLR